MVLQNHARTPEQIVSELVDNPQPQRRGYEQALDERAARVRGFASWTPAQVDLAPASIEAARAMIQLRLAEGLFVLGPEGQAVRVGPAPVRGSTHRRRRNRQRRPLEPRHQEGSKDSGDDGPHEQAGINRQAAMGTRAEPVDGPSTSRAAPPRHDLGRRQAAPLAGPSVRIPTRYFEERPPSYYEPRPIAPLPRPRPALPPRLGPAAPFFQAPSESRPPPPHHAQRSAAPFTGPSVPAPRPHRGPRPPLPSAPRPVVSPPRPGPPLLRHEDVQRPAAPVSLPPPPAPHPLQGPSAAPMSSPAPSRDEFRPQPYPEAFEQAWAELLNECDVARRLQDGRSQR